MRIAKLSLPLKRLAMAFVLLMMSPVVASAAETPDIAARYAASDEYLPAKIDPLVIDLDMSARFVKGGVLFHRGPRKTGKVWLADPATGAERELADDQDLAARVMAAGAAPDGLVIVPLDFDSDKGVLTFSAAGARWTHDAAGVVASVSAPAKLPPGVVSPDGKFKVILKGYDLWLVDVASDKETPLTYDGSEQGRYGQSLPMLTDMIKANVAAPPMPISVQWSEDSRRILTYKLELNGAYIWNTVQASPQGSQFPRAFSFIYPNAGATNLPLEKPLVIDIEPVAKNGRANLVYIEAPAQEVLYPGDPALQWEDGKVIYQWTERGYGSVQLFEADPVTGAARARVIERVKPVVTVTSSSISSSPAVKGDLVISERTGWAQLYLVARGDKPDGGKALTKGAWEVTEIVHVAQGGPILVLGVGREAGINPYFGMLYRVGLEGSIRNLTPEPLDHRIVVSEDGRYFIDRMSSPTSPTETVVRDAADGRIVARLGKADPTALLATGFTAPEPFETLSEDGKVKLYGMIYRPRSFDPSRSYPVIENVYTGPTTHRYSDNYDENVRTSTNAVAQIGAIVVTIDGRGTSQRGQAFRLPAFQNLGEVGLDDHIWVLKQMKAKYAYFDLDRVGVYGGSAGGYDTARFLLRRPDFYKVGVASSGNHDLRLDKAWWPEVSMGVADDATWEANSNIPVAKNLKGKLMLIHGDIDDNVPVAASLRLSKALIEAGKSHELVILPNTNHGVSQPYYWNKLRDFFTTNLLGEVPPANGGEK